MTRYDDTPEAYPGQHATIAARIATHNAEQDRERAAEARHGGRMFVHWPHARAWTPETLALSARIVAQGDDKRTTLPEAAFDWPVYRAAMQRRNAIRPCATLDCSGGAMGGSTYCADCNGVTE